MLVFSICLVVCFSLPDFTFPFLIQILNLILRLMGAFLDLNYKYKYSVFELMRMVQHRIDNNELKYMLNKFKESLNLNRQLGKDY